MNALKSIIGTLCLLAASASAQVASWPSRPLTWIVPFTAGGATDVMARDIAMRVSKEIGQQIVIENLGGAGGTVGAAKAAKAPADGYTYLVGHLGYMAAAPSLYRKLAYDPVKDFDTVFRFPDTPMVLLVNKTSPYKTTRDLLDAAKRSPGRLTLGHAGVGSVSQLVGALFASKAGVKFTEIPYKGVPPAIVDLIGGRVDAVFDQSNTAMRNASNGPLSAIAVTSAASMPLYPDAQPLAAGGFPGFEASTWYGLYAPKGTPAVALQALYKGYIKAMSDPLWRKTMTDNGIRLLPDAQYAPQAFAQHTADEIEKWRKVIAEAAIRID
jgi:tripartite-type tricarboxylate transporter receptor subunit TctC